jgi:hypothetical protein
MSIASTTTFPRRIFALHPRPHWHECNFPTYKQVGLFLFSMQSRIRMLVHDPIDAAISIVPGSGRRVAETINDIVIAGAGQAGARAAEAMRARGFKGSITMIGEEPHLPYERPQLSKALLAIV